MNFHIKFIQFHKEGAEQSRIGAEDINLLSSWSCHRPLSKRNRQGRTYNTQRTAPTRLCSRFTDVNFHLRIIQFHKEGAEKSTLQEEHAAITQSSFFLVLSHTTIETARNDGDRTVSHKPHRRVCVLGSLL